MRKSLLEMAVDIIAAHTSHTPMTLEALEEMAQGIQYIFLVLTRVASGGSRG